ncbi:Leucine-rich repeat and IQ domain-containing protein 1 [Trichoplax sp. H2]|nr:Leucine-rich repeat and IQ domain-containing protein 1 [Trichoplax sp. H2]|eukprot:RDD46651.1 Leucine-rich repeat and IQ domain-containing protein 1 [Trichoplax sp. H2]
MKQQMKEILVWRKKIENRQDNIMAVRKARHDKQIENSERNREVYTAKLEKEKKKLNEIQNNLKIELEQIVKVEEEMIHNEKVALELEINKLEANLQEEKVVLEKTESEAKKYHNLRENKAASTIQAHFKGFKIRKRYGEEIRIRAKRKLKEIQEQLQRLEREEKRQLEEEIKRKQEEERLRIELEKKKKQEEEQKRIEMEKQAEIQRLKVKEEKRRQDELRKQREEEERKKKAELERKRLAEEKLKKEEERRRKLEEKRKIREEQEKIRREEEERVKREEERKRQEEENRRRLEEEERKRKEEAARRKEEERKRKEEERRNEEERMRKEEERRNVEERKRKEEEERRRKHEEEKRHQEEDRKRREEDERKRKEELKRIQREKAIKQKEQEKYDRPQLVKTPIPSENASLKVANAHHPELICQSQSESAQTVLELKKERSSQLEILIHQGEEEIAKKEHQLQQLKQEILKFQDSDMDAATNPEAVKSELSSYNNYLSNVQVPSHEIKSLPEWLNSYYQKWLNLRSVEDEKEQASVQSATKKKRKPTALSKLLPFPESQLLAASSTSSIDSVSIITINSCPTSYSTSSIGQYQSLCWLSLTHCNLKALDGINQCRKLQYIKISDNDVEYLDLQGLSTLMELNAANNKLTTVHGLDGCTSLKVVDFSKNRLTRLGEITNCTALQEINLDNNLLVTIKGIQNLINLQVISCNFNDVTYLDELKRCHLLHSISFTNNSIQLLPELTNQSLLVEINLKSNCIASLENFSQSWLPSLENLNISENSLSNLEPCLKHFVSIQKLDVSDNCFDSFDAILPCVSQLTRLKCLRLNGNPVVEEPNFQAVVTKAIPYMQELNDISVEEKNLNLDTDVNEHPFITMIQRQIQVIPGLRISYERKLQKLRAVQRNNNPKTLLWVKENYFQRMLFASQQFLQQQLSYSIELNTDHEIIDEDFLNLSQSLDATQYQQFSQAKNLATATSLSRQNSAAIKIQSLWRGYRTRKASKKIYSTLPSTSHSNREEKAVIEIQSFYRGYRTRKRIKAALVEAKDIRDLDDDFNFDEIDLSQFDVKEDYFNQDWKLDEDSDANAANLRNIDPDASTNALPKSYESIPKPVWQLEESLNQSQLDTNLRQYPYQEEVPVDNIYKPQLDDAGNETLYDDDQTSEVPSSQQYPASKSEEIVNEWGFSNYMTAELMKKRARRFKQKKKITDPQRRYEQFKKLDETSSWKNVKTTKKPDNTNKLNYTQVGKPTAAWELSPPQHPQRKEDYTTSWIKNQSELQSNLSDNDTSPNSYRSKRKENLRNVNYKIARQVHSLPQLNAHVISGKTVQLINPSNENRGNYPPHDNNSYRRYSTENVQLPPISRASSSNSGYRSEIINTESPYKFRR